MSNKRIKYKRRRINVGFLMFCAVVLLIVSFIVSKGFKREALYDDGLVKSKYKQTESMDEIPVTQYFFASEKAINAIEVMAEFTGRNEDGTLRAELLNSKGDVLTESSIPFDKVKEDRFTRIKFKRKIELALDEEYCIRLTQISDVKGEGLKYYYTPSEARNLFKEASVTINGSLVMNTLTGKFYIVRFLVCVLVIFVVFVGIIYILDRLARKRRRERIMKRRGY